MAKLSDLGGESKPQEKPRGLKYHGHFVCATCDDPNDEAEYDPNERLLMWKCNNGHNNSVRL